MTKTAIANKQGGLSELKSRIWFLIGALLIFRIGSHIPVPGIDPNEIERILSGNSGILGLFNLFSGGSLSRFSVFALGVMPYISASIIVQLLTVMVPSFEQLKKEGQAGRKKISQYTRYGTVMLASVQAFGMAKFLSSSALDVHPGFSFYFIVTLTLVTGTMFLMWLGEQITERGIGNGISMLIFAGIVSGLPKAIVSTFDKVRNGELESIALLLLAVMMVGVIAFIIFVERAQRRITVNYPKRQHGRKVYAAQSSHLPLKLNMAGVIPPIFASSIILLPGTLAQFFMTGSKDSWISKFAFAISPGQPLYLFIYSACIIFFAFFYTALVYNPKETADNLKKSGAFIPGIRPGEQTSRFIDNVLTRLTLVGSLYLVLVCLLPQMMTSAWHVPFYFGGTSLLIIVVVIMDFVAQVQAHVMSFQYESLLKKSSSKGFGLTNFL